MITSAYRNVRQAEKESVVDTRTAAYLVALKRLERVYSERGIFP
jgi:glutamate dehydrogenase/leucine dehydrogenase